MQEQRRHSADPDQHDTSPQLAAKLFDKERTLQRKSFDTAQPVTGEKVRFTNVEQEWPIAEFAAYYVHPGAEPKGVQVLRYRRKARRTYDNAPALVFTEAAPAWWPAPPPGGA